MFDKILKIFQVPDLRKKILFVLGAFAVFRFMANIPMPGFDAERMQELFSRFQMFQFADLLIGGTLDQFSIVMLGLGPYITSVIVIQLLTLVWPKLQKMYREEGDAGRQKVNQYGRLMTIPFAFVQGFGMLTLFQNQGVLPPLGFLEIVNILTVIAGGTVLLMWIGELITERGIGNGVSLLIFAGIISSLPANIGQMVLDIMFNPDIIPMYILFFLIGIPIIASVVHVNEARRNIPISYARRVRGRKIYGGASTYLPLSLNPAGVIPIIFAMSMVVLPTMLFGFLVGVEGFVGNVAEKITDVLQITWVYGGLVFVLVCLFTYFYTAVTFDPKNVSENLQKMGGFVPGIRPGKPTANYISYILNRVLLLGAVFLATVAVLPMAISGLTNVEAFGFLIGGASLIIIVSVVLETIRQINAQLQMREYETI
jgi:preprotein translocase subunit SecY